MHEDGYLSLCNRLSWSVSVQRWGGGRADGTVLFSSYIICSVWSAGSSDQNFNEIFFIFLLSFLFIFKDTTHTHTLRQAHTCTHDAAWILSKPSLEDFMSNKVDEAHSHCTRWSRQDSDLISGSLQAADISVLFTLQLHFCGLLEFLSGRFRSFTFFKKRFLLICIVNHSHVLYSITMLIWTCCVSC